MTNIPSNVAHGLVTGQFIVALADSIDLDTRPDAAPVVGTVTFTPSRNFVQNTAGVPNAATILLKQETAIIDSEGFVCNRFIDPFTGEYPRGFPLVATTNAGTAQEGWTWKVTYNFTYDGKSIAGPLPHSFTLEPDQILDLTVAVPIEETAGTITIQGPRGLTGPAGPANLVVGPDNTLATTRGLWVETGLGTDGNDFTIWIEDGE